MKILLLQPPSPPGLNVKRDYAGGMGVADASSRTRFGGDRGYISLPYMSLLYSAAVLERGGHEVFFVDAQTDDLDVPALQERVEQVGPDVLVSVVNLPSIYGDLEVLGELKQKRRKMHVVVIGTVTAPLYDLIAESGVVDAIVRGDPEDVLPAMVGQLCEPSSGSLIVQHGVLTNAEPGRIDDLDALPLLPYHLVPIEKYWYHGFGQGVKYAAVFASRGCSFKCYYCPYPVGFGDCIVHRDPVKVVDEIEQLKGRYGIRGVLFRDQVFTMEAEKTHRLCDELIRRRLDLEWVVETRLDKVDETLLRKMCKAGCVRIHYGLESGDPKLFSRVGKDGAEDRMETLIQNFIMTEKAGIHAHMFVLIGLLGETWDTIRSTIATIKRIKPLTLQVAVVTPYPGTPLFDEIKEKGLLLTEDWSQYTGFNPVARTEALTAEDLQTARDRILHEHTRAIFWKRQRHRVSLFMRYLRDGSLIPRLLKKVGGRR